MSDIRVIPIATLSDITYDWLMSPLGALDETRELATAVTVALGTDRLASPDDELPGIDDSDRRGWWGDFDAEELHSGWPIGSRLWLLSRTKITDAASKNGATAAQIEQYIIEALQPFIDKKIVSSFDVAVNRTGINTISTDVTLWRGSKSAVELRYQSLWDELTGVK